MQKIEQIEARGKEMEDLVGEEFQNLKQHNNNEVDDAYDEAVNYGGSQESVESFGTKVGVTKKGGDKQDQEGEGPSRRSDRNVDKKDAKF